MSLQVLYPLVEAGKAEDLKADVVAVYGLNGDLTNTWTDRKTKAFWLKDFLPHDLPDVRVMAYGYNTSAAFGNTTADIINHAKGLLSSLIDKRDEDDISGIVIKQALFQAKIEPLYRAIGESTVGIIFLGTPHRGSEKAAYGKVLATVATKVLHAPEPRLVKALQANSEALMQLTTNFRFQLPKYQVYSFYELKLMKMLSSLVVEKYSALLDIVGEEQIPADANHEEICKFAERNDDIYQKLFKRIRRMLKAVNTNCQNPSYASGNSSYNKYYHVPYNVSGVFTGRDDILQKLRKGCLPAKPKDRLTEQKRFVLYGIGGSGKTQACLKFAQDYRERFWAIFWIDASSQTTAQQGFLTIARACGIEGNLEIVRQWLSNAQESWLLVIDNADDPYMDVSKFFPVGNKGSILVTTRNPDSRIHATVGSYDFGEMDLEDAVTLFLRAAGVEDTAAEIMRKEATAVAKTLGYLALAIAQAGAYVRQGLCSIGEYCTIYSRRRESMLRHRPIQAGSDYKFSVYTTWEVSVEAIKKISGETSDNAIELIRIFGFLHYDSISEDIFKRCWMNAQRGSNLSQKLSGLFYIRPQERPAEWDPAFIREAAILLASFSLIKMNSTGRRMSMHPLVHTWTRDCLSEDLQQHYWAAASYTLASSISRKFQLSDYNFRRTLVTHIDLSISLCKDGRIVRLHSDGDEIEMAARFALVFAENGRSWSATELSKKVLEARQRTLGSEHFDTLSAMFSLAKGYRDVGRKQEALELSENLLEVSQRTLGSEHPETLGAMNGLGVSYRLVGRRQEAMELFEKLLEASQRTLGSEHSQTLNAMQNLGVSYYYAGRNQEAMELNEKLLKAMHGRLGSEHPRTLDAMTNLALSYSKMGHTQEAIELSEKLLEASQRTLGSEHPDTLGAMNNLAFSYSNMGRRQKATKLFETLLEARQRTLGTDHPDTLEAVDNLAKCYCNMVRRQEVVEQSEKAVETS